MSNQNIDAIRTCNLGEAICLSDFLVGADHISRALGNSFSVCHLKLLMNARLTQLQDKTLALPVPLKSDRAIDVCQRRGISLNVNAVREDEGPTSAQTNIFAAVADVAALKYDRHMARQIDVGQAESQTSAGGAHQICRKTLKHRPSERQKRTDLRATAKD